MPVKKIGTSLKRSRKKIKKKEKPRIVTVHLVQIQGGLYTNEMVKKLIDDLNRVACELDGGA